MLGGIIGDLAVDTWRKDKSAFYHKLVGPQAQASQWGVVAYCMLEPMLEHQEVSAAMLQRHLHEPLMRAAMWPSMRQWHASGFGRDGGLVRYGLAAVLFALAGYANSSAEEAMAQARAICAALDLGKEGYYGASVIPAVIARLRQGMTKDAALAALGSDLKGLALGFSKAERGPLGVFARAWDAFYRSFDFTSTLHSAVKSPVDAHLTAVVAALLADAMYGSEYGMIKSKYADGQDKRLFDIALPPQYQGWKFREMEKERRVFWKKNWSLTNVDRHKWLPMPNVYEGQQFDGRAFDAIRRACGTGWENRYGIYLDNGRFYVYRSQHLLSRFTIAQVGTDTYQIAGTETSDDYQGFNLIALPAAIAGIAQGLQGPTDEAVGIAQGLQGPTDEAVGLLNLIAPTDFFSYYRGESKCAYEDFADKDPRALIAMRLWHGERLFLETHQDIRQWLTRAASLRLSPEQSALVEYFGSQGLGVLAVRLYIDALYSKWCPMDPDRSWVYTAPKIP